jgi:hypothetical protein
MLQNNRERLVNRVRGNLGASTNMDGLRTNQELAILVREQSKGILCVGSSGS